MINDITFKIKEILLFFHLDFQISTLKFSKTALKIFKIWKFLIKNF